LFGCDLKGLKLIFSSISSSCSLILLQLLLNLDLVNDLVEKVLWIVDCTRIVGCISHDLITDGLLIDELIE